MIYAKMAEIYEKLGATTKKLEKRDILADFYKRCREELGKAVLLSMGIIETGEQNLGVAGKLMIKAVAKTCGVDEDEIKKKLRETGDMGIVAEFFIGKRKQQTLAMSKLTIDKVFDNLKKLSETEGKGSQDRKINLISELLSNAKPVEAKYVTRTVLGEMRIGVAEGIVRDAIAKAFDKQPKDVEKLYNFVTDYGKVAELVRSGKMKAEIQIGIPIRVMLAERAKDLEDALSKFENPCEEIKYDGFRISIHKDNKKINIFSRRLDNVTKQFPEIVKNAQQQLKPQRCVVEGEVIAISKNGKPLPFQKLSKRIQRKYDIDRMVKEIPVQVNLFDLIYLDGKNFMDNLLKDRWNMLKKIVKETSEFKLAEHIETRDIEKAKKFYKHALAIGEEGIMVKNLDAVYQPGKRVGYWLKVKPGMEPLDLVIIGGIWGEGKRAKAVGSVLLGARKGNKFLSTGMLGSGLSDKDLKELTKKIKKIIKEEKGREIKVKPEIVIEVGYEEIQKSPKYETGYALRFPKILRFRTGEKKPKDANTVKDIENLYKQQRGRGKIRK